MRHFALPAHMIAWCEEQVALGRVASVGTYVAQLVQEDMQRLARVEGLRRAVAEARESGISMHDVETVLAVQPVRRADPRVEAARQAVFEGRRSGTSLAAIEGILARAMGAAVAA